MINEISKYFNKWEYKLIFNLNQIEKEIGNLKNLNSNDLQVIPKKIHRCVRDAKELNGCLLDFVSLFQKQIEQYKQKEQFQILIDRCSEFQLKLTKLQIINEIKQRILSLLNFTDKERSFQFNNYNQGIRQEVDKSWSYREEEIIILLQRIQKCLSNISNIFYDQSDTFQMIFSLFDDLQKSIKECKLFGNEIFTQNLYETHDIIRDVACKLDKNNLFSIMTEIRQYTNNNNNNSPTHSPRLNEEKSSKNDNQVRRQLEYQDYLLEQYELQGQQEGDFNLDDVEEEERQEQNQTYNFYEIPEPKQEIISNSGNRIKGVIEHNLTNLSVIQCESFLCELEQQIDKIISLRAEEFHYDLIIDFGNSFSLQYVRSPEYEQYFKLIGLIIQKLVQLKQQRMLMSQITEENEMIIDTKKSETTLKTLQARSQRFLGLLEEIWQTVQEFRNGTISTSKVCYSTSKILVKGEIDVLFKILQISQLLNKIPISSYSIFQQDPANFDERDECLNYRKIIQTDYSRLKILKNTILQIETHMETLESAKIVRKYKFSDTVYVKLDKINQIIELLLKSFKQYQSPSLQILSKHLKNFYTQPETEEGQEDQKNHTQNLQLYENQSPNVTSFFYNIFVFVIFREIKFVKFLYYKQRLQQALNMVTKQRNCFIRMDIEIQAIKEEMSEIDDIIQLFPDQEEKYHMISKIKEQLENLCNLLIFYDLTMFGNDQLLPSFKSLESVVFELNAAFFFGNNSQKFEVEIEKADQLIKDQMLIFLEQGLKLSQIFDKNLKEISVSHFITKIVNPLENFHNILIDIQKERAKFTYSAYLTLLKNLRDFYFMKKDRVMTVRDVEGNIIFISSHSEPDIQQVEDILKEVILSNKFFGSNNKKVIESELQKLQIIDFKRSVSRFVSESQCFKENSQGSQKELQSLRVNFTIPKSSQLELMDLRMEDEVEEQGDEDIQSGKKYVFQFQYMMERTVKVEINLKNCPLNNFRFSLEDNSSGQVFYKGDANCNRIEAHICTQQPFFLLSLQIQKFQNDFLRCSMDQGLFVKSLQNNGFLVNDFEINFQGAQLFQIYLRKQKGAQLSIFINKQKKRDELDQKQSSLSDLTINQDTYYLSEIKEYIEFDTRESDDQFEVWTIYEKFRFMVDYTISFSLQEEVASAKMNSEIFIFSSNAPHQHPIQIEQLKANCCFDNQNRDDREDVKTVFARKASQDQPQIHLPLVLGRDCESDQENIKNGMRKQLILTLNQSQKRKFIQWNIFSIKNRDLELLVKNTMTQIE